MTLYAASPFVSLLPPFAYDATPRPPRLRLLFFDAAIDAMIFRLAMID